MERLVGKKIIIYSNAPGGGASDVGVLEAADGVWLTLRKSETEVLIFSAYNIRVIKPFDHH